MRLISQNGEIDIPYENNVVHVHAVYGSSREGYVHAITGYRIVTTIGDDTWLLGEYSTEEKALCVMEMLRQQYMGHLTTILVAAKAESTYFKFPDDESVNDVSA